MCQLFLPILALALIQSSFALCFFEGGQSVKRLGALCLTGNESVYIGDEGNETDGSDGLGFGAGLGIGVAIGVASMAFICAGLVVWLWQRDGKLPCSCK